MACRNMEKANEAAEDIRKQLPEADLIVKKLDLSSLESVREFAQEINKDGITHIDYLINNAGLIVNERSETKDGFELQFGTNHLGHFLLTLLLLDKLKESPSARIINVSSGWHRIGKINFDDLNFNKPNSYSAFKAYSQSKLANVLFTRELAKRLKDTNVSTFSLHPGVIKTELGRDAAGNWLMSCIDGFLSPFKLTPFLGTQTTLYCVLKEGIESDSGSYFNN